MRLHPLSGGRYRTAAVEAQTASAMMLHGADLRALLDSRSDLYAEAVVCLYRCMMRAGRGREAGYCADALRARSVGFNWQWVTAALPRVRPAALQECIEDVEFQMLTCLSSDRAVDEFWEIAFWLCLKRRVQNATNRARRAGYAEMEMLAFEQSDGSQCHALDFAQDRSIATAQDRLELAEALAGLEFRHREAILLTHRDGLSQSQIASVYGVTDRTVRNWLFKGAETLQAYYRS